MSEFGADRNDAIAGAIPRTSTDRHSGSSICSSTRNPSCSPRLRSRFRRPQTGAHEV